LDHEIRLVDDLFLPGWRGRNVLDHDHSLTEKTADSLLRLGQDLCGRRFERLHYPAASRDGPSTLDRRRPLLAHKPNYRQDFDDLMFAGGVVW